MHLPFIRIEKAFLEIPTAYFHTWPSLLQRRLGIWGIGTHSLRNLILEVTSHHFCCVIFIKCK